MGEATIHLDQELEARLAALAARSNETVANLAEAVLRAHADEQERRLAEQGEDEQRWQRYLASGHTVELASVRRRLRVLAAQAADKVGV